jgi:hypothetical protein
VAAETDLAFVNRRVISWALTILLNLQNLHPRFKSGRRLQMFPFNFNGLCSRSTAAAWQLH